MILSLFWLAALSLQAQDGIDFRRQVMPILNRACAGCHSHALVSQPAAGGGLALDSYDAVMRGAKNPVVAPGNASASELIRRLETPDVGLRMPKGAPELPVREVELLRQWIDAGAKDSPGRLADLPQDTRTGEPVAVRLLNVFVPLDKRSPVSPPSRGQVYSKPAVLDIPGALHVEQEDQADAIVNKAYERGLDVLIGPLSPVTTVAFGPDSHTLLVGSFGRVAVWDLSRPALVRELDGFAGNVNSIEMSPDGKTVAVAGGKPFAPGEVRLYEAAGLQHTATLSAHKEVILDQAFSPDSRLLATVGFDKTVEIWDLSRRQRVAQILDHSDTVQCVAFDPNGLQIATGSMDRTVKVTDAANGAGILTINPELQGMLAVAFSPDGRYVLTAGESPEIRWWELADIAESVTERGWKPARKMAGHLGPVYDMRFSPDGSLLATASADRTVRLWDGKSGRLLRTLVDADDLLYSVAFSGDSTRLAAGGGDGLTRVWDPRTGDLLVTLLQRPLTAKAASEWLAVHPGAGHFFSQGLKERIRMQKAGGLP